MKIFSPHVSAEEKSLLESIVVDESFCIELHFSIGVHATAEEIVVVYQQRTIVTGLRLHTALSSRRVEVAPVISDLQTEVEQDKAHEENLETGPLLVSNKWVFAEPLGSNL